MTDAVQALLEKWRKEAQAARIEATFLQASDHKYPSAAKLDAIAEHAEQCASELEEALRALPSEPALEQTAWLVALGSPSPQWWTGRGDEWTDAVDGTLTNSACCAMRFARREDAERAIGWWLEKNLVHGCKAEEHIWL